MSRGLPYKLIDRFRSRDAIDGAGRRQLQRCERLASILPGSDVLLSARRIGPTGKAYGLDMTEEMLALANKNKRRSGVQNVVFLKGQIESIPLPADSVDIANCVINLRVPNSGQSARLGFGRLHG